jgi:uncharacterized membrane protein
MPKEQIMSKQQALLTLAVTSAIALTGAMLSQSAVAAGSDMEQCAGIIKAGKNDCATSTNACHSHVESDANPEAWIYVPKGTCAKLAGGRIVKVKEPPKK